MGETKSDFLARMFMMGRIEIDQDNKTLKSNTTCHEEQQQQGVPVTLKPTNETEENPMKNCSDATCSKYSVMARSFFSTYKENMEHRVLNGAKSLVYEVSECTDIEMEPCGNPSKNTGSMIGEEEWHHIYTVKFEVTARQDPAPYLTKFFGDNVKQMGDAAVKISYVETNKLKKW